MDPITIFTDICHGYPTQAIGGIYATGYRYTRFRKTGIYSTVTANSKISRITTVFN
jgi:hypothetical protein